MLKFKFDNVEYDLIMKQCSLCPRFFDSSIVTMIFKYHFQMRSSVKKLDILNWWSQKMSFSLFYLQDLIF